MFSMLVTICGGCSRAYKDPYIHDFYSSDARVQRQLIKELAHSQIEHTINDDGTITFKKKDKPEVDALLGKIEEKVITGVDTNKWKVSKEIAKNIISRLPLPKCVHVLEPEVATVTTKINGFIDANRHAWYVRIVRKDDTLYSAYFVHPTSGKVYQVGLSEEIPCKNDIKKRKN